MLIFGLAKDLETRKNDLKKLTPLDFSSKTNGAKMKDSYNFEHSRQLSRHQKTSNPHILYLKVPTMTNLMHAVVSLPTFVIERML